MGHYEKLLQKIENNPADVTFDELEKLMTKVGGFTCRSGKGDHYTFSHPRLQDYFLFFVMASLGQNHYIEKNHEYVAILIKFGIFIVGIFTFIFIHPV